MNFWSSDWLEPCKRLPGAQRPLPPTTLHHVRNMKPPAVTVWSACQAETWATGALCCVLVLAGGTKGKTTICRSLRFKGESVFERSRRTPFAATEGWGSGFRQTTGQNTEGRLKAEWLSGSSKKSYRVFIKNIAPPLSLLVWFSPMNDKCVFTRWKELAGWPEDYCGVVITYNLDVPLQPSLKVVIWQSKWCL